MQKIANEEKVNRIHMKPYADCKCAIGQDWYHIQFDVEFLPGKWYPDYMEVSRFVADDISGQVLNIEQAVERLWSFLDNTYCPAFLRVKAVVDACITHFPVEVEKWGGGNDA